MFSEACTICTIILWSEQWDICFCSLDAGVSSFLNHKPLISVSEWWWWWWRWWFTAIISPTLCWETTTKMTRMKVTKARRGEWGTDFRIALKILPTISANWPQNTWKNTLNKWELEIKPLIDFVIMAHRFTHRHIPSRQSNAVNILGHGLKRGRPMKNEKSVKKD